MLCGILGTETYSTLAELVLNTDCLYELLPIALARIPVFPSVSSRHTDCETGHLNCFLTLCANLFACLTFYVLNKPRHTSHTV